jgi:hypothetical protein
MDSDSDNHRNDGRKRPQGVRPLPRSLFSGGSLNQNSTQGTSLSTNEYVFPHPRSRTSSASTQPTRDNPPSSDSRSVSLSGAILTESPVSSPTLSDGQRASSPLSSSSTPRSTLARSRPVKKSSSLSNEPSSASDLVTADELSSQTRRRWDDVRRHFLPQRPPAQAAHVQSPTSPPIFSDVPQRPSTPKQFRLPKLGLRQVVEQAQESAGNQNKRFADDVRAALRAARPIVPKPQRKEREGTLTSMTMPFNMGLMGSSVSLGMASISSSSHGRAMRRPPSLTSVTSHSPLVTPSPLYSIISHHASIASNQLNFVTFLPHESEVLAALLTSFMVPRSEAADSERLRAMEAFEIIVRTWKAASTEVSPFISVNRRHL